MPRPLRDHGPRCRSGGNPRFKRGDANDDGTFDISDAAHTLGFLFLGRPDSVNCRDAADSNDDGTLNIGDAVHSLGFLFLAAPAPPPPFEECGPDPSPDALDCAAFAACDQDPGAEVRYGEPDRYAACVPLGVTFGDFDGKNGLDLAYASWCGGASVRLGVGDGTFGEAADYPTGVRPQSLAAGDVDADGALDLAVANGESYPVPLVSILLGAGDGGFSKAGDYPLTQPGVYSIALGDLDGNATLDVAATSVVSELSVMLGEGDGSFGQAVPYRLGGDLWSLALGDLDGDGALDLAAAEFESGQVLVLLGAGDGTFGGAIGYAAGAKTISVAAGDLDSDGALDLAAAGCTGLSILLGAGDGTFGGAAACPAGACPRSIALGDIDAEGSLDLVVADSRGDNVSILLGGGSGSFGGAVSYFVGDGPRSIALADIQGDGAPDIAVVNGRDLSILLAVRAAR